MPEIKYPPWCGAGASPNRAPARLRRRVVLYDSAMFPRARAQSTDEGSDSEQSRSEEEQSRSAQKMAGQRSSSGQVSHALLSLLSELGMVGYADVLSAAGVHTPGVEFVQHFQIPLRARKGWKPVSIHFGGTGARCPDVIRGRRWEHRARGGGGGRLPFFYGRENGTFAIRNFLERKTELLRNGTSET